MTTVLIAVAPIQHAFMAVCVISSALLAALLGFALLVRAKPVFVLFVAILLERSINLALTVEQLEADPRLCRVQAVLVKAGHCTAFIAGLCFFTYTRERHSTWGMSVSRA